MPDLIQLLPDVIANQIAAGEVILRPASVVKELLENSIDAGANHIELNIRDAGKTLIQVIDDGCGMSPTDARMCFERHATSKIRQYDDLFSIRTMGFRGEAMASVGAIARVEIKTRLHDEEIGTKILIEGSVVQNQEPCSCPPGTIISVKNLFFNTPARRNFLKSNTVENRHIFNAFEHVALAYPELSFNLKNNDLEIYHLGKGILRQRIIGLLGKNLNERLMPVEEQLDFARVYGYVGKPQFARKTRGEQFFFANQRYIRSPYLHHAVLSAYEELIAQGAHPFYVLFLEIDPARIDVNVHPTKQEIKFEEEKLLYAFLRSAIKKTIGQYSIAPTLDFNTEKSFDDSENPKHKWLNKNQSTPNAAINRDDWKMLYANTRSNKNEQILTIPSNWQSKINQDDFHENQADSEVVPVQMHNSYILVEIKSGFLIIDQQAAHERILFDRYLKAFEQSKHASQKTLFPVKLELNKNDSELLKTLLELINQLGFDIQEFGQNTFVVHGIPAELEQINEQEVIEGLLEQFKENKQNLKLDLRENLARSLAVNTSVKRGKKLSIAEMKSLIDELFACQTFYKSPGGKLILVRYTFDELEGSLGKMT